MGFAIYGAGGHGRVLYSILKENAQKVFIVFDKNAKSFFDDIRVAEFSMNQLNQNSLLLAIGNNKIRKDLACSISAQYGKVISQSAYVYENVQIGDGTSIIAGAVININAKIGEHVIINSNAVVEHDVVIHDFVHIAQAAVCSGGAEIGEGTYIGLGAVIMSGVKVGAWCTISPNSVVTINLTDNSVV